MLVYYLELLKKMNLYIVKEKHEKYTSKMIGVKWQLDVKYVPKDCYVVTIIKNFITI